MVNLEKARFNMIEQQIRPWAVLGPEVRELLAAVKREEFVPKAWRNAAFADLEIPLGHGVAMLSPKIEAQALQALQSKKRDKVLEIGTGSGYMAALLATHADRVVTVEIEPQLAALARANLARQGIANVTVETGDGALGFAAHAPYDVIMVSASLPWVPPEMKAQLKVGGRLFAIVGEGPAMTAQLIVRTAEDAFQSVGLFETWTAPLKNARPRRGFVL